MADMVSCPAEDCDYSGPKKSVLGHYSGKRDEAHTGGYERAVVKLESSSGSSDGEDTPAESEPTEESTEPSKNTGGTNPSKQSPPSEASSQGGESQEEPGPCPECGGELADFRETAEYQGHDTPCDYYCSECYQGFNEE